MDYNRIVAVTGLPGLFELVNSKSDGALVRSLDDKNTRFVSSRVHNLSHLESIEIYTIRENVNLVEIFLAMQNGKQPLPDVKDNKAIQSYFEEVFPDLDFERVYTSDMKKMVKWFEVLQKNGIDIKLTEHTEAEEEEPETKKAAPVKETPAKKTAAREVEEKAPAAKAPAEKKSAEKKSAEKKPAAAKKTAAKKSPAKKAAAKKKSK